MERALILQFMHRRFLHWLWQKKPLAMNSFKIRLEALNGNERHIIEIKNLVGAKFELPNLLIQVRYTIITRYGA